jgi:hypothetical protein
MSISGILLHPAEFINLSFQAGQVIALMLISLFAVASSALPIDYPVPMQRVYRSATDPFYQ